MSLTIKSLIDLNTCKPHALQSLQNRDKAHVTHLSVSKEEGKKKIKERERGKKRLGTALEEAPALLQRCGLSVLLSHH